MIKAKAVVKKFGDFNALDDFEISVEKGSIYGLVGSNGAGKSTLLRLINGIFKADNGSILIDERESFDNEEIKQDLVFVPDDLFFYPGYTLLDTAKYYQAMYKKFDMEYLKKLANLLKLDLNSKINTFSKGMKRQCALICALSTKCKYMFFDETFDGLDPVIRNTIKKIIAKQMEEDNTTIVMTSHNLRELEDICDNLGLLHKGGILFESDIDSIKTTMFKVQISLKNDFSEDSFKDIDVINYKKVGSVATIIVNDKKKNTKEKLEKLNPIILDFLPLTLEEVFIYEMEALGYEFNEII